MDVSNHAGPRGSSDIHAEIDAVGPIERAQNGFHPLRQNHHLVGGIGGKILQLVQVRVGHDHDMSIRVRISIENDVAIRPAVYDAGFLVALFGSIAEDAARFLVGASDVGVTPRSPEMVHGGRVAEAARAEPTAVSDLSSVVESPGVSAGLDGRGTLFFRRNVGNRLPNQCRGQV